MFDMVGNYKNTDCRKITVWRIPADYWYRTKDIIEHITYPISTASEISRIWWIFGTVCVPDRTQYCDPDTGGFPKRAVVPGWENDILRSRLNMGVSIFCSYGILYIILRRQLLTSQNNQSTTHPHRLFKGQQAVFLLRNIKHFALGLLRT